MAPWRDPMDKEEMEKAKKNRERQNPVYPNMGEETEESKTRNKRRGRRKIYPEVVLNEPTIEL